MTTLPFLEVELASIFVGEHLTLQSVRFGLFHLFGVFHENLSHLNENISPSINVYKEFDSTYPRSETWSRRYRYNYMDVFVVGHYDYGTQLLSEFFTAGKRHTLYNNTRSSDGTHDDELRLQVRTWPSKPCTNLHLMTE